MATGVSRETFKKFDVNHLSADVQTSGVAAKPYFKAVLPYDDSLQSGGFQELIHQISPIVHRIVHRLLCLYHLERAISFFGNSLINI